MSGLSERDTQAISTAVRVLREAGYRVQKVNQGKEADHGVQFKLQVRAPTRTTWFNPQSEAVKNAAIEAPEIDMSGAEVEEADSA